MDKPNKVKAKLIVEVEKAIDNWKKENPDKKVTIEIPGNSITIKLSEANINEQKLILYILCYINIF